MAIYRWIPGFLNGMAGKNVDKDCRYNVANENAHKSFNEHLELVDNEEDAPIEEQDRDLDGWPCNCIQDIRRKVDLDKAVRMGRNKLDHYMN